VLFIGNSLTYTNDLPALVAKVARAAEDSVGVAMAAGPNLAVIDHTNGATDAVARIDGGNWGFVVLQQGPTPACAVTPRSSPPCDWPHIGGGSLAAVVVPWPGGSPVARSREESAVQAARSVGAWWRRSAAWKEADDDPTAPLCLRRLSRAGWSLFAALTIYDRLFGRDVRDISADALAGPPVTGLTSVQVRALAAAAHTASAGRPADSPTPVPADTTVVSPGGGPC
jgi:hypothetical protein